VKHAAEAWPYPREPRFHDGSIASSDGLIKDVEVARKLLQHDRSLLAIEMESAGVHQAAAGAAEPVSVIAIRGISDVVGLRRQETWTKFACEAAAAFALAFLRLSPIAQRYASDPNRDLLLQILATVPDPVPISVLAAALSISVPDLNTHIQALREVQAVRIGDDDTVQIREGTVRRELSSAAESTAVARRTLFELARIIAKAATAKEARPHLKNILRLTSAVMPREPQFAYELFDALDKPLKAIGDLEALLELSNVLLDAVNRHDRSRREAECEARVRICARSWVYQRTGRLTDAAADAERALDIATKIPSYENQAFCKKCLGRLRRMQAEAEPDQQRAKNLLRDSAELLKEAVAAFTDLSAFGAMSQEVGDCYILLGETRLALRQLAAAESAYTEAAKRIADESSKEFLELRLLEGDIATAKSEWTTAARSYGAVVEGHGADLPRSDIKAWALFKTGQMRQLQGERTDAKNSFDRASAIWSDIGNPRMAAEAKWRLMRLTRNFAPAEAALLEKEDPQVRVVAIEMYEASAQKKRTGALSRRSSPSLAILRQFIQKARTQVALAPQ
jgi:tetratricopeptide (TPR) repeat protein